MTPKFKAVSVYRDSIDWTRRNLRTMTCLGLVLATGLVYLWNYGCDCSFAVGTLFILILGFFGGARWCTVIRSGPKEKDVVVVTGCDSGLGYSLALHLRSIGFRVIAAVHKMDSPGALELSATTGIFTYPLDITNNESVKVFGNAVRNYLDQHDFVLRAFVNNAGAMIFGEFEWQTEEQTRHQIEVNLLGTMRITREFMSIVRAHSTRIIVVTSHCATESLPGVATYGATKAGLSAWSTALRVELKKYGIDVVSFVPGSFITESNLLAQQRKHFQVMEAAMSNETRMFYGDYFTRYANYLSNVAPTNLPKKLINRKVYESFEGALMDTKPKAVYKCEPWRYTLYHILFKITPTELRDRLVEWFVQLPAWEGTERLGNAETVHAGLCPSSPTPLKAKESRIHRRSLDSNVSPLQRFSMENNCPSSRCVDTIVSEISKDQRIHESATLEESAIPQNP